MTAAQSAAMGRWYDGTTVTQVASVCGDVYKLYSDNVSVNSGTGVSSLQADTTKLQADVAIALGNPPPVAADAVIWKRVLTRIQQRGGRAHQLGARGGRTQREERGMGLDSPCRRDTARWPQREHLTADQKKRSTSRADLRCSASLSRDVTNLANDRHDGEVQDDDGDGAGGISPRVIADPGQQSPPASRSGPEQVHASRPSPLFISRPEAAADDYRVTGARCH
jgi:hypothetical protein